MADHEPTLHFYVTTELRGQVRRYRKYNDLAVQHVELPADEFDALCDHIDTLYDMLEAENEFLRKKLNGATKVGRLELSVHVDLEQMAVELERAADAIRALAGDDE